MGTPQKVLPGWVNTGDVFGRWTVMRRLAKGMSECRCECGTTKVARNSHLKSGESKSCGCLVGNHNLRDTRVYYAWGSIKQRCLNPNNPNYHHYGGRGIGICDRWLVFKNFYADMGEAPGGMSIDRIDNEKGYSPNNCRWATQSQQMRNARSSRILTHDGMSRCVREWAAHLGMNESTIHTRLLYKWSVEKIMTTPVRQYNRVKGKANQCSS